MADHIAFLKAFARSSGSVGAVAPSSVELSGRMLDWLDLESMEAVVEFGPGTGVFTEGIAKRLKSGTTFFAIERDPDLANLTRNRCPGVKVIEGCVTKVSEYCRAEGIEKVDAIICGLPWASFSTEFQDECLEAMFEVLPIGGKFATFAYWQGLLLPAGQRFRKRLKREFTTMELSPTAWKNLPPAFVYRCER